MRPRDCYALFLLPACQRCAGSISALLVSVTGSTLTNQELWSSTLCEGFGKKTPIFLRTPLNLECDQPIKRRSVSAVRSHRHASPLPTCHSHQLWLLPPTANCRQRFSWEHRSCLLTITTTSALTDGCCDCPCHCSPMQIDNFSPFASVTRP